MTEKKILSAIYGKKSKKRKSIAKVSRNRMPTKNRTEYGWKFPDGREICDLATAKGRKEYHARALAMAERQGWICGCGCGRRMFEITDMPWSMTFEHCNGRGASKHDDRIKDENGNEMNMAFRLDCNLRAGSPKRSKPWIVTTAKEHTAKDAADQR